MLRNWEWPGVLIPGADQKDCNFWGRECGRLRSILFVSVFQGSLAVTIIVIGSKKNAIVSWALNFRLRMLLKGAIIHNSGGSTPVY